MASKRILYIVPHRLNRSPGQRFRCEHFIPILQENGYEIKYSNLLSKWDDVHFYKKGAYILKLFIFIKSFIKRSFDVLFVFRYDAIFIYREAFMIGTTVFERAFKLSGKPIIYDFDDSIWLNDTSEGNQNLAWLKKSEKTNTIISLSTLVIVGNEYLANHAKKYNPNVQIIPTTIDTDYHLPKQKSDSNQICIGWTGTETTLKHFRLLENVLLDIQKEYGDKVIFKQINNIIYENKNLNLISTLWSAENEIEKLQRIDIGIMPLPNDEWSKGKCGFKGLQYMSLEIPTIMSPVGVNTEIIEHGVNGFLAETDEDWKKYLRMLIDNETLRKEIGKKGRQTIIEKYSISSQKDRYLALFKEVIL
jgi:glycosyltransferase involved in cell wall biosynthesis